MSDQRRGFNFLDDINIHERLGRRMLDRRRQNEEAMYTCGLRGQHNSEQILNVLQSGMQRNPEEVVGSSVPPPTQILPLSTTFGFRGSTVGLQRPYEYPLMFPAHRQQNFEYTIIPDYLRQNRYEPTFQRPQQQPKFISCHNLYSWEKNFDSHKDSDKLVVVCFFSQWSALWQNIAPTVSTLSRENPDVVFIKLNVDELKSVAEEYNVQTIPTFVFLRRGDEIDRVVGAKKNEMKQKTMLHLQNRSTNV